MIKGFLSGARLAVGGLILLCSHILLLPSEAQTRRQPPAAPQAQIITHPVPVPRHQSPLRDYSYQNSQQRVLQWLRDADYAAIEDYFAPCFASPPVLGWLELDCHDRLNVSAVYDLRIQAALQFWTIEHPESYLANVLMANHLLEAAWAHRGFGFSYTVSRERMASYESYLAGVSVYAEAARALAPEQPYALAILVYQYGSQTHLNAQASTLYSSYISTNPYSYIVRNAHLTRNEPRWGGSDAILQELVDSATPFVAGNEPLRLLSRWPAVSIANDYHAGYGSRAKDDERAIDKYRAAVAQFPEAWGTRLSLIQVLTHNDEHYLEALRLMHPFVSDHLLTHRDHHTLHWAMHRASAHLPRVHLDQRALALHPDSPILHAKLGDAYRAMQWHDLAVGAYEIARQRQRFNIFVEREYRRSLIALGVDTQAWNQDVEYLREYLVYVFPVDLYLTNFVTEATRQVADLGSVTATPAEIRAALEEHISPVDMRRDMEAFWRNQSLDAEAMDVVTTFYAEMRTCACYYNEAHRQLLSERATSEYEELLQAAVVQAWEFYVRRVNAWLRDQ